MDSDILAYAMCGFAIFVSVVVAPIVAHRDRNTQQGNDASETD